MFSPPQFYRKAPDYVNFGSIGTIIGHELTHGYDIQGRQRNQDGNYYDWWSPSSDQEYRARTECFEDQYSNYTVKIPVNDNNFENLNLNGKNTIAENLADNVGIRLGYYVSIDYRLSYHAFFVTQVFNLGLPIMVEKSQRKCQAPRAGEI